MLSIAISLIIGALGLYWSLKARNAFTKLMSLLLAVTWLLPVVPYAVLRENAPFALAFASLMAGFEPTGSMRIKTYHKVFFALSGIFYAVMAIDAVVTWPFELTLWPVVLLFLILAPMFFLNDRKLLRTRLGMLVIWAGMGVRHLLEVF